MPDEMPNSTDARREWFRKNAWRGGVLTVEPEPDALAPNVLMGRRVPGGGGENAVIGPDPKEPEPPCTPEPLQPDAPRG